MNKDNYSYSKNFQSDLIIKKIYEKNFNKSGEGIIITSLTGGTKSAVYLIQDLEEKNGNDVAINVLKLSPEDDLKFFKREVSILGTIHHPCLI